MATKNGLCPYCKTIRIDRRIFPVNPEASTCFCPVCMKEVEPMEAIQGYINYIQKLLDKANNTLFVACDPVTAYQEYADVIELENKNAYALLGRILCLIYMGKVRKSYLTEAYILLENTSFEGCNLNEYVAFIKKINFALDEYESVIHKKLTFKTYYFDVECLKLYWVHLYNIIRFKELIIDIIKQIKTKYISQQTQQTEVLINMISHNVDEKKKVLKLDAYIASGEGFRYTKTINGKACLERLEHNIDTKLSRYRLSSLDENDKKKHTIKDQVFKDYTSVIKANKSAVSFSIILLLFALGFGVAGYFFHTNLIYFISFVGSGSICFIASLILFILHLSWRAMLKKRKLRID